MKLTKDQDAALKAIDKWLKDKSTGWMFCLAGFAGTGKTTLLQHLISHLTIPFLCCAPTGKAASVLRSKIKGLNVLTIHQMLYVPTGQSLKRLEELEALLQEAKANDKPTTELKFLIRQEREKLAKERVNFQLKPGTSITPGKLVIVDEASMVSEQMRDDLEKTGCRVLFVGDSGQLPPVNSASWFIDYEHDASLNTIVRQALDSPIIRLSMEIRNGNVNFSDYASGQCIITETKNIAPEEWLKADQVITGYNSSRHRINRFFRKKLGWQMEPDPMKGEKMICLKNDHYKIPPWINGVQFIAHGSYLGEDGAYILSAEYEETSIAVEFYPYHCHFHYDSTLQEEPRELRRGLFEADFAYAITVHKSQGSEWPFVILADDGMKKGDKPFRQRWLYTAVTRAKERLILAMK